MPDFAVKTSGTSSGTELHMDGVQMRNIKSFAFGIEAGSPAEVRVGYAAPAFQLEASNARLVCRGTELSESEEHAVLAYLQEKYRE